MTSNCNNHFWVTHSHAKGLFCVSCGIDKPEHPYGLIGDYDYDTDLLIRTIENLEEKLAEKDNGG